MNNNYIKKIDELSLIIKNYKDKIKEKEFTKKEKQIKEKEKMLIEKEKKIKEKEKQIENLENEKSKIFKKYEKEIIELKEKLNNLLKKYNDLQLEKQPILVGLNNIGATCYMNATLQCLSNTTELTNYFLKIYKYNENDNNKLISNEYYKVIIKLWNRENNNNSYSPNSFKNVLSKENPLFAGVAANDSKDLINFLLERFHQELNIIDNNIKVNNYIANDNDQLNEDRMLHLFLNEFKNNYNSIISNLFYGVMETKSQCNGCNNIKYNFQIYSFLEFPLEQVNYFCFKTGKRNAEIFMVIPIN